MTNRTKRTPKRANALLDALRSGCAIGTACARAGIGRTTLHLWRKADSAFDAAVEDAIDYGTDVLEDVARDRAVRQSDTLLIFLLKARRPEKYRETVRTEHTGGDGGEIVIRYVNDWRAPPLPPAPASNPPDDTIPG